MNRAKSLKLAAIPLLMVLLLFVYNIWIGNKNPNLENSADRGFQAPEINSEQALANLSMLIKPAQESDAHVIAFTTPAKHDQSTVIESLEGTDIDGALQANDQGDLILNVGVRDFFDYFLSASGDISPQVAIDEVVRYAVTYLPEPARQQAIDLFKNYLKYKQVEFKLQQIPLDSNNLTDSTTLQLLRDSFGYLRNEREKLFDNSADQALFGLEDAYADYTLRTLEVMGDEKLSDLEVQREVDMLRDQLPAEIASFERRQEIQRIEAEKLTALLDSQADDSQVFEELRMRGYADDQANQILEHRQQKTDFEQRYKRYIMSRDALSQNQDDPQLAAKLAALRDRHFLSEQEQTKARLRDLDSND